jgi:hypothetical protein
MRISGHQSSCRELGYSSYRGEYGLARTEKVLLCIVDLDAALAPHVHRSRITDAGNGSIAGQLSRE